MNEENKVYMSLIEHDNKEKAKKQKCLEFVKSNVSVNLYRDVLDYIGECDFTDQFSITEELPSEKYKQQEDEFEYIKESWVNQYCNGGYSGDEFAGWCYIKINQKEYLKFHYSN